MIRFCDFRMSFIYLFEHFLFYLVLKQKCG